MTSNGVTAASLLLTSVTTAPLAGAGPLNVIVPVDVLPAVTLKGVMAIPARPVAGTMMREAVCDTPLQVAVMVTVAGVETIPVK